MNKLFVLIILTSILSVSVISEDLAVELESEQDILTELLYAEIDTINSAEQDLTLNLDELNEYPEDYIGVIDPDYEPEASNAKSSFDPYVIPTTVYTWYWTANPPLCTGFLAEDQRFRVKSEITVTDLTLNQEVLYVVRHFPHDPPHWEYYYMCSYGTHIYLPDFSFYPTEPHNYHITHELTLWKWTPQGQWFVLVNTDEYDYDLSGLSCGGSVACQCGDILVSSHTMDYNLYGCAGNGIEIGSDSITLNCNGHSIIGDGQWDETGDDGIYLENKSYVNVRNCKIEGFQSGIYVTESDNIDLSYNEIKKGDEVTSGNAQGITIYYSNNNQVRANKLKDSDWLLYMYNTTNTQVYSNKFVNAENGVRVVSNSIGNKFFGNIFYTHPDISYPSAYEDASSSGNYWNWGMGNTWQDFNWNPGYPNNYKVPGDGNGYDWYPQDYYGDYNEQIAIDYHDVSSSVSVSISAYDRLIGEWVTQADSTAPENEFIIHYPNGTKITSTMLEYIGGNTWQASIWTGGYDLPRDVYLATIKLNGHNYLRPFAIYQTQTTVRGYVSDINGTRLAGATVSMYKPEDLINPYLYDQTDQDGYYEFMPINRGTYFFKVSQSGYLDSELISASVIGDNDYYDLNISLVPETTTLLPMVPIMTQLHTYSTDVLIKSTQDMTEITLELNDTLGTDEGLYQDLVVDWGNLMLEYTPQIFLKPEVLQHIQLLGGVTFGDYLHTVVTNSKFRTDFVLQFLLTGVELMLDNGFEHVRSQLIGNEPLNLFYNPVYNAMYDNTTALWNDFQSEASSIVNPDFDFNKANNMINTQLYQYDRIRSGADAVLLLPIPDSTMNTYELGGVKRAFLEKGQQYRYVGELSHALGGIQLVANLGAILAVSSGVGAPAAGALIAVATVADVASAMTMYYEATIAVEMAQTYMLYGPRVWFLDMAGIPYQYKQTKDFLIQEAQNPHYLHKDNSYSTSSSFSNKNCFEDNNGLCYYCVTSDKGEMKTVDITVHNSGDTTPIRIVPTVRVPYDSPAIVNFGDITLTNVPSGEDRNVQISFPVYFIGNNRDHDLYIHIFSGASFLEVLHMKFRPSLHQEGCASKRSASSIEYDNLISEEYLMNVSNNEFEYVYSTAEDLKEVQISLMSAPFETVDLHAYMDDAHVGYNYDSGSIDYEFPAEFESEAWSDSITIENPTGNTYTLKGKLRDYGANSQVQTFLDIVEVPRRDTPEIEYSPAELTAYAVRGRNLTLITTISEMSNQYSASGIEMVVSNISMGEYSLNLLTDSTRYIDFVSAGSSEGIAHMIEIPSDAPLGEYIGNIEVGYAGEVWNQPISITVAGIPDSVITIDPESTILEQNVTYEMAISLEDTQSNPVSDALLNVFSYNHLVELSEFQVWTDSTGEASIDIIGTGYGNDTVYVEDIAGNIEHIEVYVLPTQNIAPELNPFANKTVNEMGTVYITPVASDPNLDELNYTINSSLFTWMEDYDRFKWKTGPTSSGHYSFLVTVSDGEFEDSEVVHVTVLNKCTIFDKRNWCWVGCTCKFDVQAYAEPATAMS